MQVAALSCFVRVCCGDAVRAIIDSVAVVPNSLPIQVELCEESIEWCKVEKRKFLRLRLQLKLAALCVTAPAAALLSSFVFIMQLVAFASWRASVTGTSTCRAQIDRAAYGSRVCLRLGCCCRYAEQNKYQPALKLVQNLVREVKKLDDKPLLVEIFLLESKIHYLLFNVPKARVRYPVVPTSSSASVSGHKCVWGACVPAGVPDCRALASKLHLRWC